MRFVIFLLFLICNGFALVAQKHQTIFGDRNIVGAFGAPIVEMSTINGQSLSDVGGGGALIFEDFFLGGYGLGNDFANVDLSGEFYDIRFRHSGFWLGYVPAARRVVHFYGSARIGWGKTDLRRDREVFYSDRVFVATPEIGLELNLFSFLKVSGTGGYRWVNGIENLPTALNNEDFRSPVGSITFRIGGF